MQETLDSSSFEANSKIAPCDSSLDRPCLRFGEFILDQNSESLSRDGRKIPLKPQVYTALKYLLSRPEVLVTREALSEHIWSAQQVDFESGLNTIIRQIRRALEDNAETPQYIETVPRKGYRFLAPVFLVAHKSSAGDLNEAAGASTIRKNIGLRTIEILSYGFILAFVIAILAVTVLAFHAISTVHGGG